MVEKDLIGLSISWCIQDIIEGKVPLSRVRYIVAGTKIETQKDFEVVCNAYTKGSWRKYSERARLIFQLLWDSQQIIQPRVNGHQAWNISNGHWAKIISNVEDIGDISIL